MKSIWIIFVSLLIAGVFQSCSTSKQLPKEWIGTYYGFLPCADCPGISYTLVLESRRFHRTMEYYDRNTSTTTEGKLEYKDGQVELYENGHVIGRYAMEGNQIYALDGDGKRITGPLADHFILYRGEPQKALMPSDRSNLELKYKGTGNEPFWMIQIKDQSLYFKGLMQEEVEFEVPISEWDISDDGLITTYRGQSEGNHLAIKITHRICQDNMSGFYFPTQLQVELKTPTMDLQNLEGCGQYLGKYQLNGRWKLVAMDIETSNLNKQTLLISTEEARISGHAGCNQFFGSIREIGENSISFDRIGSTKMACPELQIENKYLGLLGETSLEWVIEKNGTLILKGQSGQLTLERLD